MLWYAHAYCSVEHLVKAICQHQNHHFSRVCRQMQVTSWSLWISMRNGVLPAERFSQR